MYPVIHKFKSKEEASWKEEISEQYADKTGM